MSSQTTDTKIMNIHGDFPINNIREDRFGRTSLADHVVKAIQKKCESEHDSLCLGIYGKWGEGKTSFVNMLKNLLLADGEKDNIYLANFNPWIINDEQGLIKDFFKTIAVDAEGKLKEFIAEYGGIIAYSSQILGNFIAPGLGNAFKKHIKEFKDFILDKEDKSIAEQKNEISRELVKSQKHLLVFIDDIDRLDSDEMHAVFRLVRQVADFKNTIYVLSLDEERVSKSIGKYYGDEGEYDGRQFLEKIVQIPIVLPQIQKNILRLSLRNVLIEVFNSCGLEGVLEAEEILDKIAPLFETEREIVRYKNQLQFFFPTVYTEVNYSDYCILEAIKTFNHKAYNLIKENKPYMMKDLPMTYEQNDQTTDIARIVKEEYSKFVKRIVGLFPPSKQEAIKTIMKYYLPAVSNNKNEDTRAKRLCSPRYFDRYFLQSSPNEMISDKLADTLSCNDVSEIQYWIQGRFLYKDTEVAQALFCMADRKLLNSRKKANLCIALSKSGIVERKDFAVIADKMSKTLLPSLYDEDLTQVINVVFSEAQFDFSMVVFGSITDRDRIDVSSFIKLKDRLVSLLPHELFRYSRNIYEPFCKMWRRYDVKEFIERTKLAFEYQDFDCIRFLNEYLLSVNSEDLTNELDNMVRIFGVTLYELKSKISNIQNHKYNTRFFERNFEISLDLIRRGSDYDELYY